ncbi:MAG: (2Fe-2S)-binding protein, partial [Phycisphaerae bacterium]|nr:(2Fe-2S)-binding protein [Phycisphaerae bacterium]
MSDTITFTIDGVEVQGKPGQTIMQAADEAGIYIPRLCAFKGLSPFGSCRVCTVMVNGRPQTACTQPVAPGMTVENDTPKLKHLRQNIVEMLFVEG